MNLTAIPLLITVSIKVTVERWEILACFRNKEASIGCEPELECEQKERTEV